MRIARLVRPSGRLVAGGVTAADEERIRVAFGETLTPVARETEDGVPQAFRMDRGAEPVSLGDATPDQLEIAELRWSPIIQTLRDGVDPRW